MRPLEIIIVLLNLAALVLAFAPLRQSLRWPKYLPTLTMFITIVHLLVEHYRWQMVPAYAMAGIFFFLSLRNLRKDANRNPARGRWPFVAGGLAFLFWLITIALPVILPVPRLPTPPGPFAIGSVTYQWIDTSRAEPYSSDPDDQRELVVQIWYPAQPTADAVAAPFLENADAALPAFANILGVPAFTLDHLRLVGTNAYGDAPIREDGAPYPIVIVSHGYASYRTAAVNQMEALASSGYIAIAIDHPYAAAFTVFPDGRVVVNDPAILPPAGQNEPGDQEARENLQAVLVADQQFVLDQLELLNAGTLNSFFAGKLDLERIGFTGVSLGGGAILWTCAIDVRCKAGLVQDGWYEPLPEVLLSQPLQQPFMFMQSETHMWEMDNLARLDTLFQGVNAPAFHLKLLGILHYDFGDYPLLTPLSGFLPERGSVNGERAVLIVDTYLLAFFDTYLKDQPSLLLNGPSDDYPEVQFESHSP